MVACMNGSVPAVNKWRPPRPTRLAAMYAACSIHRITWPPNVMPACGSTVGSHTGAEAGAIGWLLMFAACYVHRMT